MFELPEYLTLARQMNATLSGKTIACGQQGNRPHKNVWYNRSHAEFTSLTQGKAVGTATVRGRWLFLPLDPGYVLVLGECGGKILFHPPGAAVPAAYHLRLDFDDGAALTVTTKMWGAMELYAAGEELDREYVRDMRPTPIDDAFTFAYFNALVDAVSAAPKRSAKALLTQDQLIPGLGNAIAQDILFAARLHPRHPLADLTDQARRAFYDAIVATVEAIAAKGGRYDEYDLFNARGGYVRRMDANALARPCPACGGPVEKINYLGGACYLCPACQQ